ncbi:MAG: polyprenyl synthetase family protein [Candidatus Hodarchaeales archaeon]|jgi:geranylgeranyl diphosphate synthase type II
MSINSNKAQEEVLKALKNCKQDVWPIIEEYISPKPLPSLSSLTKPKVEEEFWHQVADYPLRGGKYIRSSLIILACEALGGSRDDALFTAAAMELCQTWALIHDDIEDDSKKRRGKPALHYIYPVAQAINAGDGLHIMMWGLLARNLERLSPDLCTRVWKEFYNMLLRTVVGQSADLAFRDSLDLTDDDVYYIMDGKTGYYTIGGPIRLGAIIAGYDPIRDPALFEQINDFSINLGRAFQIIDDLLDLTTDFEGLKEKGNDIQEGKRSILLLKLLQKADQRTLEKVQKIMTKPSGTRTVEEIDFILSLMKKYDIFDETRALAEELADKCLETLEKLPFNQNSKKLFNLLVQFLISRTL